MASTDDWGRGDSENTAMVPVCADTTKAITKASTKPSRNKRVVQPWQTCSKRDIKPYKKYNVLFGERKFAQEYPKEKQTLSFTDDLPTEIRLRVYDFLFNTPGGYFEFWTTQEKSTRKKKWQKLFRSDIQNKKALRIMRLSKKIREEVADYFYGRVNMRFSGGSGFIVLTAFNHTIKPWNCSFIKHITVRFPHDISYDATLRRWERLSDTQERRGMRMPFIGYRQMQRSRGTTTAECNFDITARRGFHQLGAMAGLKLLEILVPWDYVCYDSVVYDEEGWAPIYLPCGCEGFWNLSPEDQVRHRFEGRCRKSRESRDMEPCRDLHYWALLANLKQHTSSDDLTIALVYDYNSTRRGHAFQDYPDGSQVLRNHLRRGRWVAAYASVMGYKFGYARFAENGAYKVRYDEDTLMAESLELLKADPVAYDPLLEPPELSG